VTTTYAQAERWPHVKEFARVRERWCPHHWGKPHRLAKGSNRSTCLDCGLLKTGMILSFWENLRGETLVLVQWFALGAKSGESEWRKLRELAVEA
jgi:hypothetical protein